MPLPMHVTRSLKISPYQRSRLVLDAMDINDVLRGCDTYVKSKILPGHMISGYGVKNTEADCSLTSLIIPRLFRSAAWRRQPATDGQKSFILKRWTKKLADSRTTQQEVDNLTRGEAANIITRLKHGAQVYHLHSADDN